VAARHTFFFGAFQASSTSLAWSYASLYIPCLFNDRPSLRNCPSCLRGYLDRVSCRSWSLTYGYRRRRYPRQESEYQMMVSEIESWGWVWPATGTPKRLTRHRPLAYTITTSSTNALQVQRLFYHAKILCSLDHPFQSRSLALNSIFFTSPLIQRI